MKIFMIALLAAVIGVGAAYAGCCDGGACCGTACCRK